MKGKMLKILGALTVVTALVLSGCSTKETKTDATAANSVNLTFSAAKSLSECLPKVGEAFEKENPGVKITFNFGGSGSLRQQIEQGADADLFMPAGKKDMDLLLEKDLVLKDTVSNLLSNQIVLVVPAQSSLSIGGFEDLKKAGVQKLAVGEPESVPAGKYAVEALKNMGVYDDIESKLVYGKDVREVLTWVETGNADAGIVYLTEAKLTDKVKVVAVADQAMHTPVQYPAAVVGGSKNAEAAKALIDFMKSGTAKELFESYGYTITVSE